MNNFDHRSAVTRSVVKALQGIALAAPLVLGAVSAHAAPTNCDAVRPTTLDVTLAAKADQGVVPFVRFVQRTKTVYQLDVAEALAMVDRFHREEAACTIVAASRS